MNEDEIAEALDEYDHLFRNVLGSRYQTFDNHLTRMMQFLDQNLLFKNIVTSLTDGVDFKDWYGAAKKTGGSMVGSGSLDWPMETKKRLGLWLGLMRHVCTSKNGVMNFCTTFLYAGSRFDDMVSAFSDQIVQPFGDDFRRYVEHSIRRSLDLKDEVDRLVPTAHEPVPLDHNSPSYENAMTALGMTIDSFKHNNEYASKNPDIHGQRLAELEAGKVLLQAPKVRARAIIVVLGTALLWLVDQFASAIISEYALAAWQAIKPLIGL